MLSISNLFLYLLRQPEATIKTSPMITRPFIFRKEFAQHVLNKKLNDKNTSIWGIMFVILMTNT